MIRRTFLVLAVVFSGAAAAADLETFANGQTGAADAFEAYIADSKGLVEFPAGTFLLERSVVVKLPETGFRGIRGANGATRIIMAGPGPAFRIEGDHQGTADPKTVQEHTWERERFPVISDIEIVGKHPEADGIQLFRTMKCTIRNVSIRRCRYGIHLVERNRNFLLADSHVYDGLDTGVFLDECNLHQANIIGNHISYNQRAGIRQAGGDVHNIQITGNDIEYNAGSEETSGEIVLEAPASLVSEYTISSNTIQARPEHKGANILITGDASNTPHAARIIAITGNVIGSREKNVVITHGSRTAIAGNTIYGGTVANVHLKNCRAVTMSGNTFGTRPSMHDSLNVYDDGVIIEDSEDCVLDGNIVSECRYGSEAEGGAITIRRSESIRVSDCQITDSKWRAVHIVDGVGCSVAGNSITAKPDSEMKAAIAISGDSRQCLVQHNLIRTPLEKAIVTDAPSTAVDTNTVFVVAE